MTDIVERLRGYVSESWGSALRDTREAADALEQRDKDIERLRAELDHFKNSGIIEVAVRNASVSEYMRHWEGRALKAESERDALRADAERMRAALVECEHQTHSLRVWSGSAWSYHPPQAGRIAKIARAAIDAAMALTK